MLIDFSVTNYRSIKDKQTFSMQPIKRIDELPEHIINNGKHSALSSAIIYGRNASGKSNLLKAFFALIEIIHESYKNNFEEKIKQYEPYKLNLENAEQSIDFEINFVAKDNIQYHYQISFSEKEISKEILLSYPNGRETKLFLRETEKPITFGKNIKGKSIEDNLYSNQSFLSKIGSNKIETLLPAYQFLSSLSYSSPFLYAVQRVGNFIGLSKEPINRNIIKLLKNVDTNIINIFEEEKEETGWLDRRKIFTEHVVFKDNTKIGSTFFLLEEESEGTQRLVSIGGEILKTLNNGNVIIIDEFHESLHPLLTKTLINLFHNPKTNPNGAQLIFATHDVSLLDNELFRRDQIWFSEKGNDGASTYYSLADLKGIRAGVPLEKYYLKGAFGATPIINEHDLVFNFGEKNEQK